MHRAPNMNDKHSQAIAQEIGQRLQAYMRVDAPLPPIMKMQLNRLRDLEDPSPPLVPEAEPEIEGEAPKDDASHRNQSRFGWPWRRNSGPSK
jgi:hypothetical protein